MWLRCWVWWEVGVEALCGAGGGVAVCGCGTACFALL